MNHKERKPGDQLKAMLMTVTGGILGSGMGLGVLVLALWGAFGHRNSMWLGGIILMLVGTVVGIVLFILGMKRQKQLNKEDENVQR
ncbi:MAG: phage holin family protein [Eubacteriales bacterium]|nr:phage holin family protein [Eubacteriales bacterium]